jgi:hypothetical protein
MTPRYQDSRRPFWIRINITIQSARLSLAVWRTKSGGLLTPEKRPPAALQSNQFFYLGSIITLEKGPVPPAFGTVIAYLLFLSSSDSSVSPISQSHSPFHTFSATLLNSDNSFELDFTSNLTTCLFNNPVELRSCNSLLESSSAGLILL